MGILTGWDLVTALVVLAMGVVITSMPMTYVRTTVAGARVLATAWDGKLTLGIILLCAIGAVVIGILGLLRIVPIASAPHAGTGDSMQVI